MAIIVVGGSGRGVGKTALVCGLIAVLPELSWTAVKITAHEHSTSEPVWEEETPGQGSDTARYLAAGAKRAFLLTALDEANFPLVLDGLWSAIGRDSHVIFESNRIVHHLRPDLCLLVCRGPDSADDKSSFQQAVPFADALIEHAEFDQMLEGAFEDKKGSGPIFHVASFERISPEMRLWLREKLLTARAHNEEHRAR
ncbi:MAG TPA: hypothetical protein VFB43_18350 [Terracidiphilus sp.]|nr:hypothetical protein [Terracidiphilus sp.]